jgi:cobalamin biosynthesis Mg chelatase CobN
MPAKSRRNKAKRYQQTNKNKITQSQNTTATAAPTAGAPAQAAPVQSATIQATPGVKTTAAAAVNNQYVYVSSDLKRIGILTGIILIILFILYFILV